MTDHYESCLNEMFNLGRFGIKLGLDTITHILENLDSPHKKLKTIHIAGTNGKGSVASTITSILSAAGHTTGLYTSPHLVHFNERFSINGIQVTDGEIVEAYKDVKEAARGARQATFFEITTAMALHLFHQKGVEWAIMETGMGGRLDATNIIKPAVSVITNISVEHTEYLGDTLAKIVYEKAGIIKSKTPVISGARQKVVRDVINTTADNNSAPVFQMGQDFKTRKNSSGTFSYFGISHKWRDLKLNLAGDYQIQNASMAIAACELLEKSDTLSNLTEETVRTGLAETRWPGRLETVCQEPLIIIDGAHNLAASQILANHVSSAFKGKKSTLIIGILSDKPYEAILSNLLPHFDRVILTQPQIDRSMSPDIFLDTVKKFNVETEVINNVDKAIEKAVSSSSSDDAICIAGSLYVVGEAKQSSVIKSLCSRTS